MENPEDKITELSLFEVTNSIPIEVTDC